MYKIKAKYANTGNYNSKASQQYTDAYGQIVNLLNITSVDAQNQQQMKDAMVIWPPSVVRMGELRRLPCLLGS